MDDYRSDEDESGDKGDMPSYYVKAGFNNLPSVDWKTSYEAHLTHLAKAILMPYLGTESIPDNVREANIDGNEETLRRIAIDKVIHDGPSSRQRTSSNSQRARSDRQTPKE